jgi:hypothetical protein
MQAPLQARGGLGGNGADIAEASSRRLVRAGFLGDNAARKHFLAIERVEMPLASRAPVLARPRLSGPRPQRRGRPLQERRTISDDLLWPDRALAPGVKQLPIAPRPGSMPP